MGCAVSRVTPADAPAVQRACEDAVRTILALPRELRAPFDTFLSSSPLYASAAQGVAFADAVESAWEAVSREASSPSSPSSSAADAAKPGGVDPSVWQLVDTSFRKFRHAGAIDADLASDRLKVARFDARAARTHLRNAKDITVRMLALHPFPAFAASQACKHLLHVLRTAGSLVLVPPTHTAAVAGAPRTHFTGAAIAAQIEAAVRARDAIAATRRAVSPNSAPSDAAAARRAAFLEDISAAAETLPCMFTIADMTTAGAPLVFVNTAFLATTLFETSDILGHNCRFLQGPDTSKETIEKLRDAIRSAQPINVEILNYRKDGTPFVNFLSMKPVFERGPTGSDRMCFYIGVQFEASSGPDEKHASVSSRRVGAAMQPTSIVELEALLKSLPDRVD
jgi:hypothetical protein